MSVSARRSLFSPISSVTGLLLFACLATSGAFAEEPETTGLRYLEGHQEPVYAVAYSADGRWLVSGGFDHHVKVWDRNTGSAVRNFVDHSQIVLSVDVSKDGQLLASGGLDKLVFVNRMPTVEPPAELAGLEHAAGSMALSPDGKRLAVVDGPNRVVIFNTESHAVAASLAIDTTGITRLRFSADGAKLFAVREDGRVDGWQVDDGAAIGSVYAMATDATFAAAGDELITVDANGTVRVLAWPPPAPRSLAGDTEAAAFAIAPDGKSFATADAAGLIRLRQTSDGGQLRTITAGAPVSQLAFSSDGAMLAGASADGVIRIWNTADAEAVTQWSTNQGVLQRLVWRPGRAELLSVSEEGKAVLWRTAAAEPREVALTSAPLTAIAASPDRTKIAVGDWQGKLHILAAHGEKPERTLRIGSGPVRAVVFDATGQRVVAAGDEPRLRIVSLTSGGVLAIESIARPVRSLAVHPAEGHVAAGCVDGSVQLWNAADGALVREWSAHNSSTVALEFASDGSWLATAGGRAVAVWNPADGSQIRVMDTGQIVTSLAASPDGARLVVGTSGGKLIAYNKADGAVLFDVVAHPGSVRWLDFAADGRSILTTGEQGEAKLWDAANGTERSSLTAGATSIGGKLLNDVGTVLAGDDGRLRFLPRRRLAEFAEAAPIRAVAFSPDGTQLFVGGEQQVIGVWNVDTNVRDREIATAAAVSHLAVQPETSALVAATSGQLQIWALDNLDESRQIDSGQSITALALSPEGKTVVASADGSIRQFDLAAQRLLDASPAGTPPATSVAFLPEGGGVLAARTDGVHQFPTALRRSFATRGAAPLAMRLSADGAQLLILHTDGVLTRWNPADGQKAGELQVTAGSARLAAFDRPLTRLAAVSADGQTVIINLADNAKTESWSMPENVTAIQLTDDGTVLHAAADGRLTSYRTTDGVELRQRTLPEGAVVGLATLADSSVVLATVTKQSLLRFAATPASPPLKLEGHGSHVYGVAFSPDGTQLASVGADKVLRLWNVADGAQQATSEEQGGPVYGVAYNPEGGQLATCSGDKTLRTWNPADAKQIRSTAEGIGDGLYSVTYSPDGANLLTAGLDKAWHVFAIDGDKPLRSVTGHSDSIYRAIYSPSGTRVATLGYAGTLFIWDAETGQMMHQDQLPVRVAYAMAYSPDGAELAIGSVDPRVLLYTVPEAAR